MTAPKSFGRFIIKPRSGATAETLFAAAAQRAGVRQSSASALTVKRVRTMGRGAALVRTSRALSLTESDALLAQLRSDPGIAWAQPDYMKQRMDVVPNDTHFATLQWDFTNPMSGIGAPQAWDVTSGTGVVVAVLDTGFVDHSDLAANLVPGHDFISWYGQVEDGMTYPDIAGDGNGRDADAHDPGDFLTGMEKFCSGIVQDSTWHGTHVAGTIAAVTNNAKGVAGVAYGAKVQPVRVLGRCGGLTSDIADGITWASGGDVPGVPRNPTPAEVLNLSLGGFQRCSDDPATQDAIDGAIARGTSRGRRRRQFEHERGVVLAGKLPRRDHGGRDGRRRRTFVVLQLRSERDAVRAGRQCQLRATRRTMRGSGRSATAAAPRRPPARAAMW